MKKTHPKFHYQCTNCSTNYQPHQAVYLCPKCSPKNTSTSPPIGVLKTIYDYKTIQKKISGFQKLKKEGFLRLLPINTLESLPNLKIGNTPFYHITQLNNSKLPCNLLLKDEAQNPTFSFKDRASMIVSAFAKESGLETIVAASTGNAGSSLAGICAAQGQKAIVMVPQTAPLAKLIQIVMYGAKIIPVKGTYDDAFDLSVKATETFGWYNRNTAFNPLTIEGKKTVSFELFEQLNYKTPDRVFVPTGDGVIISGVYKGFEDLLKLNIIGKLPTIIAVQSEGSDNLVRNIGRVDFKLRPSSTLADSISVDIPRNFYMAQAFIQKYKGSFMTVSDEEILKASKILSGNTGLFAEPASAAAFAGFLKYLEEGKIDGNSNNVVLLTGSGLKDLRSISKIIEIPKAIEPTIEDLNKTYF